MKRFCIHCRTFHHERYMEVVPFTTRAWQCRSVAACRRREERAS